MEKTKVPRRGNRFGQWDLRALFNVVSRSIQYPSICANLRDLRFLRTVSGSLSPFLPCVPRPYLLSRRRG